jgi:hypothetical protein
VGRELDAYNQRECETSRKERRERELGAHSAPLTVKRGISYYIDAKRIQSLLSERLVLSSSSLSSSAQKRGIEAIAAAAGTQRPQQQADEEAIIVVVVVVVSRRREQSKE